MNSTFEFAPIAVLGSTGSVGEQALDVARASGIPVHALCANRSVKRVEEQIREFRPAICAMADENAAAALRTAVADMPTRIYAGEEGICRMIAESNAETVINAIIGEAGLRSTLTTLENKKKLALANKESLVVAGEIVMAMARENGQDILPVDSEHCAIYQCLQAGRRQDVKRLILTASGGPFFGRRAEEMSEITVEQTLAHPTWNMGAKITVDSATLMNKGFEVIEAVHLFGVRPSQIEVVVHRESIIHSMVEYADNSVIAQLSVPDMRLCVQYALTGPVRIPSQLATLDLTAMSKLTFYKPDMETFLLLPTAIRAIEQGGALPAVLNAANEVAVAHFLNHEISFRQIFDVVSQVTEDLSCAAQTHDLEGILSWDNEARALTERYLTKK